MQTPWGHGLLVAAGLSLLAAFVLALILRPWLVLLPFLVTFSWIKKVFAIPGNLNKVLSYYVLEKDSAALEHHAAVAAALWSAGQAFRPAAREVFGRVTAGYGIAPVDPSDEIDLVDGSFEGEFGAGDDTGGGRGEDAFRAASRAAAAAALNNSRATKAAKP